MNLQIPLCKHKSSDHLSFTAAQLCMHVPAYSHSYVASEFKGHSISVRIRLGHLHLNYYINLSDNDNIKQF